MTPRFPKHAFFAATLFCTLSGTAFSSIPANHWARPAIKELFALGLITDVESFVGSGNVDRYEMSAWIERVLELKKADPQSDPTEVSRLEALRDHMMEVVEVHDEANRRADRLLTKAQLLRDSLSELKAGKFLRKTRRSTRPQLSGLLAVAAVGTDTGAPPAPGAGGVTPRRTRYLLPGNSHFFTLPRASVAFSGDIRPDLSVRLQLDHGSDPASAISGVARGVGVNEAYFVKRNGNDVEWKLGGFALPFQDAELNGPFRTATRTITPGAITSFFEAFRVTGLESRFRLRNDLQLGVAGFTGMDLRTVFGAGFFFPGTMSEGVGLQALGRSATLDNEFGYYADLRYRPNATTGWRGRLGYFENGGDNSASAPATATLELNGILAEVRGNAGNLEFLGQYLDIDADSGGAGGQSATDMFTLMVSTDVTPRVSASVRWDDWQTDTVRGPGLNGRAFTFGLNRTIGETSMLQFEWLAPTEGGRGPGTAAVDVNDDLYQIRYTVWF